MCHREIDGVGRAVAVRSRGNDRAVNNRVQQRRPEDSHLVVSQTEGGEKDTRFVPTTWMCGVERVLKQFSVVDDGEFGVGNMHPAHPPALPSPPGSVIDHGSRYLFSSFSLTIFCSSASWRTVLPCLYASFARAAERS